MSVTAPVSLVVVSQNRPQHLLRLLQSLRHQSYESFEVIVVADQLPEGFAKQVKFVSLKEANISAARNLGIAVAASEIVAFCDDDAIPDPPWLERLTAPFASVEIGAATGFTRGRNGISRQWGAMRFDRSGVDHAFGLDENTPFHTFDASTNSPIKLIGTNMAFRKSALLEINGFDEGFRFYLDETDAKLRMDLNGWKTAIVPLAQVHHGFAASARRAQNRVPTDLFEIGASKAYFVSKHSNNAVEGALRSFTSEQLSRLTRMVDDHKLRRRQVNALMETLGEGFAEGLKRRATQKAIVSPPSELLKFATTHSDHVVLCATPREEKWAERTARDLVAKGKCISVIQLVNSPRYFQVRFTNGFWLHKGGVFGKSVRTQPLFQFFSYKGRFEFELNRIAKNCPFDAVVYGPKNANVPS